MSYWYPQYWYYPQYYPEYYPQYYYTPVGFYGGHYDYRWLDRHMIPPHVDYHW